MKLTKLEEDFTSSLKSELDSCGYDDCWLCHVSCKSSGKTLSGVIGSLVKKGIIETFLEDGDVVVRFTEETK